MNRRARWFAVSVFALASAWNYLDRGLLTAQSPRIINEFHLSRETFGWLNSAFYLAYAIASPFVAWFLDWFGLEAGMAIAVGLWSLATLFTGLTQTFTQLVIARASLGIWESAGFPAAGKLGSMYLEPKDRAIGAGITQVGISIGTVTALFIVHRVLNWRPTFFIGGLLGLLWIPLWLSTRRAITPAFGVGPQPGATLGVLRDRRLVVLAIANLLWMLGYGFWSLWATQYLVDRFHLTTESAASYVWVRDVGALLGGFAGGWLSRRAIERGAGNVAARSNAILISAIGCLCTLLVPLCPGPAWVAILIGMSLFCTVAGSVNIYTIPVDLWGPARAATAISALVFSFGLSQAVNSPISGVLADHNNYFASFCIVALPPLAAWALIRWGIKEQAALS